MIEARVGPIFSDEILNAIRSVLDSGQFILGPEVRRFEKTWAEFCQSKEGVGVANGLDALEIGLRSVGVKKGDEVITTPMTAYATILAIHRVGATPVFADINSDTALMSLESAKRCVSKRTKAIILVHLYGRLDRLHEWRDFAESVGAQLLEDCSQAHGARWAGRAAGSFGTLGAFSLYPTKNLGALGDAGIIVTSSESIAQKARMLRNYGQSERYRHEAPGTNSRLDEIQAAILNVRLTRLSEENTKRQEIAAMYREGLQTCTPDLQVLKEPESSESHVYHQFVVTVGDRAKFLSHLISCGIKGDVHYPLAAHQQPAEIPYRRDRKGLKHAEWHSKHCVSLPVSPNLSWEQVNRVIDAVRSFKNSGM